MIVSANGWYARYNQDPLELAVAVWQENEKMNAVTGLVQSAEDGRLVKADTYDGFIEYTYRGTD